MSVMLERRVDLPTEGKPIIQTRAFPKRLTSKPSPALAPLDEGSRSWVRYLASLALS